MTSRIGWVAAIAAAVAVLGVFLTWTSVGSASLDGTQAPNNGWLVVIAAAFTLGWVRAMVRGSWIGVVGVLLMSVVMAWTTLENWLENRDVLGGTPGPGVVVVLLAAVVLGACAVVRGVQVAREGARRPTTSA